MLNHRNTPMRLLACCLAFFLFSPAIADEEADDGSGRVDELHDEWSEWVLKTANQVDGFFSNSHPGIRARISLPNTENRLKLILGDDEDEGRLNDLDDNQQNISLQVRGKRETALKQIRFDIGIRRRDSRYQPYVRARHSKAFTTDGPWVPRLTNSFYYFTKSKFEYRGQADFDRVIGQDFFFRPMMAGVSTSISACMKNCGARNQRRSPTTWKFIFAINRSLIYSMLS